ncbi:MAG: hypothetical protein LBJ96_01195 [Holosporaceae bacterium]|nr:hypothetical protein [Holosporaceae bacterium]
MKKISTLCVCCLVCALSGEQSAAMSPAPQYNPGDSVGCDILEEECPFYDSLPDNYKMLAESGEALLNVKNRLELNIWVDRYHSEIGLCDMLMQLILASRNFMFYFGTEKALCHKSFTDRLRSHYPRENSIPSVNVCGFSQRITFFSFVRAAFLLSNSVCRYEEKLLNLSFSNENEETILNFQDVYNSLPQTLNGTLPLAGQIPSLFYKVHLDICLCCKDKLEGCRKDYLTTFPKYDCYEHIISSYINKGYHLSGSLLTSLHNYYEGRGTSPIETLRDGCRTLQKTNLFEIAASFGLARAFRQLILMDKNCFQKDPENISLYAVDGGNNEIIRICEQEGYQFPHNGSHLDSFSIAYGNSAINTLRMFLENFPDSSKSYSSLLDVLVKRFYDSPITTSKTRFLLNVISRYCPIPDYGSHIAGIYQNAVEQNIIPIIRYLVEMKIIPLRETLSYALSAVHFPGRFSTPEVKLINVKTAKYFIEQGADIDTEIINFSRVGGGYYIRRVSTLLQLALNNNDPEFAQFLRDEAAKRPQLPEVKEEIPLD